KFSRFVSDPRDNSTLPFANLASIFEDKGHVLWVGTALGGGIGKLDLAGARIPLYQIESYALYEEGKGVTWIGNSAGLSKLDRKNGTLRNFKAEPSETTPVHAIHADEKGALWLGTFGKGLRKFDPQSERFTTYEQNANESGHINSDIVF